MELIGMSVCVHVCTCIYCSILEQCALMFLKNSNLDITFCLNINSQEKLSNGITEHKAQP